MLKRLFPHPYLSLTLTVVWLMLVNDFRWGSLVMGLILGIIIPAITEPYWPDRSVIRNPHKLVAYLGIVLYDIVKSNLDVAMIVLFKSNKDLQPAWVNVPLDLTSPESITALASTVTMTPGTLSAELSTDGRSLLVHCLHAPDPDSVRDEIKTRYEARLKEIFV
ncbi:Na+/H+ antiporter subunit E [Albirhodobacter sp. R86504]|uniref:Na+/H+ antiporter subunit E n=1 Tax=Albirhodobacter sp. R86504 TaxID=3093848 RepID=UPI00366BC88B